jgi:formylglycine-generating enzyme required for sulfatase activity
MGANGSGTSPVRNVRISEGFYMGKYQVQQGYISSGTQTALSEQEYYTIVNDSSLHTFTNADNTNINANPSQFQANQRTRPVERVSWYDALYFCNLLSTAHGLDPVYTMNNIERAGVDGVPQPTTTITNAIANADITINWNANGYRLPTEAEWEYAAKGGDGSPGNFAYSGSDFADNVAWYNTNTSTASGGTGTGTQVVGGKLPNVLGIYDMSGNIAEWCWDRYITYTRLIALSPGVDVYNNPKGPPDGAAYISGRTRRGGSWNNAIGNIRNVIRTNNEPTDAMWTIGFRVVRGGSDIY